MKGDHAAPEKNIACSRMEEFRAHAESFAQVRQQSIS